MKKWPFFVALLLSLQSCGYYLRGVDRPFFKNNNISSIYVSPVQNNSYKAGVEITLYNALRKRFAQGGYVRVIDEPGQADSIISATVNEAIYVPLAVTTADKIASDGVVQGPRSVQIASSYQVTLKASFELKRKNGTSLWRDDLVRMKSFPASNYLGALGSTSSLINEGEFERVLNELSVNISTDAEESINAIF